MAEFFYLYAKDRQTDEEGRLKDTVYWDSHDFGGQRAFSFLCYMYGFGEMMGNEEFTDKYDSRLRNVGADSSRLKQCAADAQKNIASWELYLGPRYRNESDKEILRNVTLMGLDGALKDLSRFRVTYAPGEPEADGGLFYRNERLRYYTLAYIADLLTIEFDLGPLPDDSPRIGSVDIFSRACGEPNAYYSPKTRSITVCHELHKEMADAYIRYHTGKDPAIWWESRWRPVSPVRTDRGKDPAIWWETRWAEEYGPVAVQLLGVWTAEDGSQLELTQSLLTQGGAFTLRRGGAEDGFTTRHGFWGVEGDEIWLIETRREGDDCFNPACRPSATADGLTVLEFLRLRAGLFPRGKLVGSFKVAACAFVSVLPDTLDDYAPDPDMNKEIEALKRAQSDTTLGNYAPNPDLEKELEELGKIEVIGQGAKNVKRSDLVCVETPSLDSTIEIDGAVFRPSSAEIPISPRERERIEKLRGDGDGNKAADQ